MNNNEKELPPEKIQKEYEANPSYILEKIRKENINKKTNNLIKKDNIEVVNNKNLQLLDNNLFFFQKEINFKNIETKQKQNIMNDNNFTKNDNIKNNLVNNIINNNDYIINNSENINLEKLKSNSQYKNNNKIENNILKPYYLTNQIPYFSINFHNYYSFKNTNKQKSIFYEINNLNKRKNGDKNNIFLNSLNNYWGSINLQLILSNMDNNEISSLLINILPYINEIMCLEYGNYFFQKLVKKLNTQQKIKIYQVIEPHFSNIAMNKSGTHSIQSLIDEIQTPNEQIALDNLLNKNMLLLFNDKNAYHIIMKIIIEKPENSRNNINLFIINNIKDIVINPYGAYCVNKFIVNNIDINLRLLLLKNIHNNIQVFFFQKCSCSILLLLLKYYNYNLCTFIFEEVKNRLIHLVINPISYSFVNKILLYLNNKDINLLYSFIWDIYKKDNLLKALCETNNGFELIKIMFNFSNSSQKGYIKEKLNSIKK